MKRIGYAAAVLFLFAGVAPAPKPCTEAVTFQYRGGPLPDVNRAALEQSLRAAMAHPAHPVRVVVTISDRVVAMPPAARSR
jgi:hypothetical protein